MEKRKGRKETEQTLIQTHENGDEIDEEEEGGRFFACYLLTSICPRFKGHTYIGFTVNPRRRIRQHNGEIRSGAFRTKKMRPWEMVLCIYGFPTNVAALQFEWAWQHPVTSLAVRAEAVNFKSLSGLANKIKLAYTMLTLPAWQSMNLTVNFFSTKYQKYISGCPTLPKQIRTRVCSMDDLPCYDGSYECADDEECTISGGSQEFTTEESMKVLGKVDYSPINYGSSEEHVHTQKNQKDDSNFETNECLEETWTEHISSFVTISCDTVGYDIEDGLIRFDGPLMKQSKTEMVNDKEEILIESPCFRRTVEVIDLFTPSPCHMINSISKRRRATVYPEIIDLTNSPLFV
ncbi:hypothetical protein BUALT_Bualt17G0008300 [Buddleja alternifolia]|uniref:Structure-specific endonuclease subunit SLX1 homolog n=1 Tax=Buddleja alternifolia TaxID=168488 RepID=A0AAV6W5G4_9LAMI|nr:hypothetical protein BUALT_Bualt17G0008300 [Buddleja alternifolia]